MSSTTRPGKRTIARQTRPGPSGYAARAARARRRTRAAALRARAFVRHTRRTWDAKKRARPSAPPCRTGRSGSSRSTVPRRVASSGANCAARYLVQALTASYSHTIAIRTASAYWEDFAAPRRIALRRRQKPPALAAMNFLPLQLAQRRPRLGTRSSVRSPRRPGRKLLLLDIAVALSSPFLAQALLSLESSRATNIDAIALALITLLTLGAAGEYARLPRPRDGGLRTAWVRVSLLGIRGLERDVRRLRPRRGLRRSRRCT